MSQLDEVLGYLAAENGEQAGENDESFFTAVDDASWIHPTQNEEAENNDENVSDVKTPQAEEKTPTSQVLHREMPKTSTPQSIRSRNALAKAEQKMSLLAHFKEFEENEQQQQKLNLSTRGNSVSGSGNGSGGYVFQTKAEKMKKAFEESLAKSKEVFDEFFGIRIRNPKISSATFNSYVEGFQKVRPSNLKQKKAPLGDWVTLGVVSAKSDFRKSSNSNDYLYIMLADLMVTLKDCQSHPLKVLMFGDCVKEHWKIQVSTAVALLSPPYADPDGARGGSNVVVKLTKPNQLLSLGICPDFTFCKARKKDGEVCRNFVNASVSERCVFHIEASARQFAARRGAFSCTSTLPPKKWEKQNLGVADDVGKIFMGPQRAARPPGKLLTIADVRKGQKVLPGKTTAAVLKNESEQLNEVLKARADSLGAKNLTKHLTMQQKEKEEKDTADGVPKVKSFKEFLSSQQEKNGTKGFDLKPCLGRGAHGGDILLRSPLKKMSSQQFTADLARKKAVAILRKKSDKCIDLKGVLQTKSRKRLAAHEQSLPGPSGVAGSSNCGLLKKSKLSNDELKALLQKKSSHEDELCKEDQERESTYFNNMEKKEKVETFVTSLMEIKDQSVITCKKCGYTAQKQSDFCKINGHLIVRHKADKRFYRCCNCSKRIVCFELMPTKPCPGCGEKNYERVAMRDERKVKLPEEQLLIRGEERKYVNK